MAFCFGILCAGLPVVDFVFGIYWYSLIWVSAYVLDFGVAVWSFCFGVCMLVLWFEVSLLWCGCLFVVWI